MSTAKSITRVEYREVTGFPGYRVGSDGSVWSRIKGGGYYHRTVIAGEWRRMRDYRGWNAHYYRTCLTNNYKRYYVHINVLVLECFVGPRPPGMVCRHLNGDSRDNRLENLAWGTPKENTMDMFRHGRAGIGMKCSSSKLTDSKVRMIRRLCARGVSNREVAGRFGIHPETVNRILRRDRTGGWSHVV